MVGRWLPRAFEIMRLHQRALLTLSARADHVT